MKRILPVIVVSQFLCTSLWFAGNAVLPDLVRSLHAPAGFLASITGAVQLGFIGGTLVFALLAISDRYSPSKVFFACSIIAAVFNLGIVAAGDAPGALLLLRGLTGFFLAGIYPVGMKIAADHFGTALGRSLGMLVGALVIGTAFPHLLRSITSALPWTYVLFATSMLSVIGGFAIRQLVPDGAYRQPGTRLSLNALSALYSNRPLRAAALGYFGHMWELYTFWAFVPLMLRANFVYYGRTDMSIPLLTFLVIAPGGLACMLSGALSRRYGAKRLASLCLALSGLCCLLSPLFLFAAPSGLIAFLGFWGLVVVADSPLFSTLVAHHAPAANRGSILTIVNCIGFSITIVSIGAISALSGNVDGRCLYTLLAAGPALGLLALSSKPGLSEEE